MSMSSYFYLPAEVPCALVFWAFGFCLRILVTGHLFHGSTVRILLFSEHHASRSEYYVFGTFLSHLPDPSLRFKT
ncbi:uncharacterized protein EV420DRAFT_1520648 [Desarmillaria tabescens]|uniref:Uncharacterized protein n=1 Tax=Armillaria tabescens TaxID=1929756 RepID=A0AA39TZK1_ARMTA|nr:uncharacterized protein EV420DRAFT_1520648 [Desarmillaria tabescens]KAK0463905.1 hypothetical protein EV420DRAFT_1520648 [Desarmillaria tabescens]